jgi:hypothetical protein
VRTSFIALHILYVDIQAKFIASACNSNKATGDTVMKKISLSLLSGLLFLLTPMINAAGSSSVELHSSTPAAQQHIKSAVATHQSYQSHVWFHRIELHLSGDINANGYYHRLEVEFDADTTEAYQLVFAEFTLLPTHGAERVYYTSSVFELFRQSSDDWLAVDTVLEHHFAADDYLLTVRLFDAHTGYMLAEISGFDDSNLDYIPLEDYAHDSYIPNSTTVEVSAGTTGILLLLALCLVLSQRLYPVLRRS